MTTADKLQIALLALAVLSMIGSLIWHIAWNPVNKTLERLNIALEKEGEKREREDAVLHKRITDRADRPCPQLKAHIENHPPPAA